MAMKKSFERVYEEDVGVDVLPNFRPPVVEDKLETAPKPASEEPAPEAKSSAVDDAHQAPKDQSQHTSEHAQTVSEQPQAASAETSQGVPAAEAQPVVKEAVEQSTTDPKNGESGEKVTVEVEDEPKPDDEKDASGEFDAASMAALAEAVKQINARNAGEAPEPPEQQSRFGHGPISYNSASAPDQPTMMATASPGEPLQRGVESLISGGASLIGGAAALTGSAFRSIGRGAASLAGVSENESGANAVTDGGLEALRPHANANQPLVLPKLSTYRVEQVENASEAYQSAQNDFWSAGKLPAVRELIEQRAQETGVSSQDVIEKMKPNGEYADLHEKLTEAVSESPDAQASQKAMNKALNTWTKQYGRAKEELLNPDTSNDPHFADLSKRVDKSREQMFSNASDTPQVGEEQSHIEKLREVMQKIAEKLKEIAQQFLAVLRGKDNRPQAGGEDHAPRP